MVIPYYWQSVTIQKETYTKQTIFWTAPLHYIGLTIPAFVIVQILVEKELYSIETILTLAVPNCSSLRSSNGPSFTHYF